ncbi:RNA polymerase sigma factor [Cohnella luojiensis]|uniref:RNA polymerase sigma factor n=1 Tax=Cohnella luojiensis TaxID=652876 RepID=UPI001430C812|nr:RNA polymerase sigma factor [Cohnella luojiensis]
MSLSKEKAQQIYLEHSTYIYRVALLITKSAANAEDIVQDAFIQFFQKYDTFDESKPIKPWIYKIALNTARKLLRKQRRLTLWRIPLEQQAISLENIVLANEGKFELWEKINKLGLKYREMIVLHYYMSFKLPEISEILGIPLGTCKSRLHHALKKLRILLPEEQQFQYPLEEIGGRRV